VQIEPEAIIHLNQEFEIHKALVVIPSTKGRIMRYRPKIIDWGLRFYVIFEEEIQPSVVKEAFEIAGKYSGLGDWRPEKKGRFGKFQVVLFKEAKD